MPDLFGNLDPIKPAEPVVRKNLTTENDSIVPAGVNAEGYDFSRIRRKFHKGQWYFAYKDVVGVLAETKSLNAYCRDLKKKMIGEGFEWCEKISLLKLPASDGKTYSIQCFSQEDILRLIEEIPSPKAEPLKREIARLANERLEEIENPAKGVENAIKAYKRQGKSGPWIEARMRGIATRKSETDTLQSHGITKAVDFAHFTDQTNVAVYGHKAQTEKALRGVPKSRSLRDCSTETELGLLYLHESACRDGIEKTDAYGRHEIDGVYDVVGAIIANTKQALDNAF